MRKIISLIIILLLFIPIVSALEIREGDEIIIEDMISESLYVAGGSISIDAQIDGDVTAFGGSININSPIEDDIMACGGQVSINAPIGKTAHVCGGSININSEIGGDLTVGGGNIIINEDVEGDIRVIGGNVVINGEIDGDILATAGNIIINGPVSGSLAITAEELTIKGVIDGDVNANAEKITFGKDALVKGDFKYTDRDVLFNEDQVVGSIIKKDIETKTQTSINKTSLMLFSGLALLLIGIVVVLSAPRSSEKLASNIQVEFLKSLLYGFIALVVIPVFALLLAITVIGLPLSIIIILLYAMTIYISKVFVGLYIGRLILKDEHVVWATSLGLIIYLVLASLPFIGAFVTLLTVLLGLGSITIFATTKKTVETKTIKSKKK